MACLAAPALVTGPGVFSGTPGRLPGTAERSSTAAVESVVISARSWTPCPWPKLILPQTRS